MRKYLFLFALLALLLVGNDASAQTTAKPTNEQLEAQITELEKEIEELKSVDELKSDMQDSLLNKEKDKASNIYNASMWFIAAIGVLVAVGGLSLTYFSNKIAKHQKKIELVLDSKDFDNKVEAIDNKVESIEQRLATIRFEERLNTISTAKRQFKTLCKEIDKIISDVQIAKEHKIMENDDLEEILGRDTDGDYGFDDYVSSYERVKKEFIAMAGYEITPMDDVENEETVEEALTDDIEDLESLLEEFERIAKEIDDKMLLMLK
jgi:adenylosuccinate synthase